MKWKYLTKGLRGIKDFTYSIISRLFLISEYYGIGDVCNLSEAKIILCIIVRNILNHLSQEGQVTGILAPFDPLTQ